MFNRFFIALLLGLIVLAFVSCDEHTNEDKVKEPTKDGAVETVLSIRHAADSSGKKIDILTTTDRIWFNNLLYKTVERYDTLPYLGLTTTDAENGKYDTWEDNDGNQQSSPQTSKVQLPKDYEIYITVK